MAVWSFGDFDRCVYVCMGSLARGVVQVHGLRSGRPCAFGRVVSGFGLFLDLGFRFGLDLVFLVFESGCWGSISFNIL